MRRHAVFDVGAHIDITLIRRLGEIKHAFEYVNKLMLELRKNHGNVLSSR